MKWLKMCVGLAGLAFILLPVVLCFILFGHMREMNTVLGTLTIRVEALAEIVNLQRRQMEEMTGSVVVIGGGSAKEGGAANAMAGQELESQQGSLPETESSGGETSEDGISGDEAPEAGAAGDGMSGDEASEGGISGDGTPTVESEPAVVREVYLTFDDGPSEYTDDILDILDRYGVKATFFVVGKTSDSAQEALREIAARGHSLGMHSYTHKYAEIYSSVEDFAADFRKIRDYLFEATGVDSVLYRFPGGSSNAISDVDMGEFAAYLDARGVRFFDWNIASGDGGRKLLAVEELVRNSTDDIEKFETSVILLHDSGAKPTTVEALPIIIEKILSLGNTVILPITEDTELIQHIRRRAEMPGD